MAQVPTVAIDGELYQVAEGRECVTCKKAEMAVFRRTGRGNTTEHLLCPRCSATAHRTVHHNPDGSVAVLADSDNQ